MRAHWAAHLNELSPEACRHRNINLTQNVKFTAEQISLLTRGLNFIPTKVTNKDILPQTKFDIQQYHRRLKLTAHYDGAPPTIRLPPKFAPAYANIFMAEWKASAL